MTKNNNEIIDQLRSISGEIPNLSRDESCPIEVAQSAFEKIEQLKPRVLDVSDFMIRDQKLNKVLIAIGEPAIPYLEHALNKKNQAYDRDVGNKAILSISKIGEPSIKTLSSIFYSHPNEQFRVSAAHALIHINEDGQGIVRNGLSEQNEDIRVGAVFGIAWVVDQALMNNYFDDKHVKFTELLIPHVKDSNDRIRERVLRLLLFLKSEHLSTEKSNQVISEDELMRIIDSSLDDKSPQVRETALNGLMRVGINSSNAAILVKVFEDPSGKISNDAVENMFSHRYNGQADAEAIADGIINELIIRVSDRPKRNFNPEVVAKALRKTFNENPRIYGQTLEQLCNIAFDFQNDVRRRSIFIAKRINESEFRALVNERSEDDPISAKSILKALGSGANINEIATQISETDPSDIQQNAANQIKLLESYNEDGLKQANQSFKIAIIFAAIGLVCLIIAVGIFAFTSAHYSVSVLPIIGGVFSEFIAGTMFYLYNQTRKQLTYYHQQMNRTQRFLLANSLVESLNANSRDEARRELIMLIATMNDIDHTQLLSDNSSFR